MNSNCIHASSFTLHYLKNKAQSGIQITTREPITYRRQILYHQFTIFLVCLISDILKELLLIIFSFDSDYFLKSFKNYYQLYGQGIITDGRHVIVSANILTLKGYSRNSNERPTSYNR